ncbi:opsin-3-like [Cloeon dipterum]|uniref:opsin-3-like n=1 Tax=Cloeon dipterum TaxID=197152 RepID=UPI00321F82E6
MLLNPSLPLAYNSTFEGPHAEARAGFSSEAMAGVNLPPELIGLVDQHWLNFPPASSSDHTILGIVYLFIFIAGVFGNGCVLWIFLTTKSLRTSSNVFVANLAVLDLVMMAQLPIFVANSLYQGQVMGKVGCQLFGTLGGIAGMGAAVNNVAIAYDRYRTIAFPLDGRMSMKSALLFVLFIWIWAMPFNLMPAFEVWNRFVPEGFLTTCSFDYLTNTQDVRVFVMCIFIYAYLLPVSLLVLFYSKILVHVKEHTKAMADQARKMGVKSLAQGQDEKSAEIRIAKVACGIFFLFLCAWTPYATVALMGAFHSNRAILTPFASMVPAVFAKSIACVDPWVYAISHPKFREQMHKRLPWLISEERSSSKASDTTSQASNITSSVDDHKA